MNKKEIREVQAAIVKEIKKIQEEGLSLGEVIICLGDEIEE